MKYDTFMKLFSVCAAVAVAGAAWSDWCAFRFFRGRNSRNLVVHMS